MSAPTPPEFGGSEAGDTEFGPAGSGGGSGGGPPSPPEFGGSEFGDTQFGPPQTGGTITITTRLTNRRRCGRVLP